MSSLKKIAAVVFSFCLFSQASFSKEPAFILYSDGTWEKAGTSVLPAPNTATLKIQAGLTMRSGDTKPVNNTKIVLSKIGIPQICKAKGISIHTLSGGRYTVQWANLLAGFALNQSVNIFSKTGKEDISKINESLLIEKIAEDTTDFNGQATFAALPIRRVYANMATELGSSAGMSAWSVPVDLKPGDNKLILSNDNLSVDFD